MKFLNLPFVWCRNISAGGSDEVVEAMVQQEVLGPLADLLGEYRESWSSATTDLGQEASRDVDPMSNTFVHATHLLWNLWWVKSFCFILVFNSTMPTPFLLIAFYSYLKINVQTQFFNQ